MNGALLWGSLGGGALAMGRGLLAPALNGAAGLPAFGGGFGGFGGAALGAAFGGPGALIGGLLGYGVGHLAGGVAERSLAFAPQGASLRAAMQSSIRYGQAAPYWSTFTAAQKASVTRSKAFGDVDYDIRRAIPASATAAAYDPFTAMSRLARDPGAYEQNLMQQYRRGYANYSAVELARHTRMRMEMGAYIGSTSEEMFGAETSSALGSYGVTGTTRSIQTGAMTLAAERLGMPSNVTAALLRHGRRGMIGFSDPVYKFKTGIVPRSMQGFPGAENEFAGTFGAFAERFYQTGQYVPTHRWQALGSRLSSAGYGEMFGYGAASSALNFTGNLAANGPKDMFEAWAFMQLGGLKAQPGYSLGEMTDAAARIESGMWANGKDPLSIAQEEAGRFGGSASDRAGYMAYLLKRMDMFRGYPGAYGAVGAKYPGDPGVRGLVTSAEERRIAAERAATYKTKGTQGTAAEATDPATRQAAGLSDEAARIGAGLADVLANFKIAQQNMNKAFELMSGSIAGLSKVYVGGTGAIAPSTAGGR
jgi:hypothetical protein